MMNPDFDPLAELQEAQQRIRQLEINQAFMAREISTLIDKLQEHGTYLNQLAVEIQTDRLTNLTRLYPAPQDESKRMRPWWYRFWGS